MEGLGERIRALRERLGEERQQDFAEKLGFNKRQMGAWERGEAEPPAEFFREVARKYGFAEVQKLLLGNETGTENAVREEGASYVSRDDLELSAALARHPVLKAAVRKVVQMDDKFIQRAQALADAMAIPLEAACLVMLMKEQKE